MSETHQEVCDSSFEELANKTIEDIDKSPSDLGSFEEIAVESFQELEKYNDAKLSSGDLQVFYFNIFIMYTTGSEYPFEYLKLIPFQATVCKNAFLNLNIFQYRNYSIALGRVCENSRIKRLLIACLFFFIKKSRTYLTYYHSLSQK